MVVSEITPVAITPSNSTADWAAFTSTVSLAIVADAAICCLL